MPKRTNPSFAVLKNASAIDTSRLDALNLRVRWMTIAKYKSKRSLYSKSKSEHTRVHQLKYINCLYLLNSAVVYITALTYSNTFSLQIIKTVVIFSLMHIWGIALQNIYWFNRMQKSCSYPARKKMIKALMLIYWSGVQDLLINDWTNHCQKWINMDICKHIKNVMTYVV